MRSRRLAGGPVGVEPSSVGEIDVQPAVVVVVKESQAASFGFDDVALVVGAAPDVWGSKTRFASYIDERYLRSGGWVRGGHLEERGVLPFPERGGERIQQTAAEDDQRRAQESAARESHGLSVASF